MRSYGHTLAKNPQTLVASKMTDEIMKNGRLPQMFAPEAVKKVVNPIQNARKPMMRLAAISRLTLYFMAMMGKAGVTIGPKLLSSVQADQKVEKASSRSSYTRAECKDDHDRVLPHGRPGVQVSEWMCGYHRDDYQFRGSFGLSDGCGWRMMSPSRFSDFVSSIASSQKHLV